MRLKSPTTDEVKCISQKTIQSKPENRYRQQMSLKSPTTDEVKCISHKTTVPAREQIYTDGKYASNHPQPMRLNVLVRKLYCLKWLKFQFFELENSSLFAEFLVPIDWIIFLGL